LALYSQEFDNAEWIKTRTTVTANATASPDGATTADLIIPSVDNNTHFVNPSSFSFTSGTVYTWSVFAKASGYNFVNLAFDLGAFASTGRRASFNLSNGTVAAVQSGVTASIIALADGWYRCSITATANATASVARGYFFVQSAGNAIPESYAGDGISGIFIWQAQLETGSVATSPIVTTAGTASRVADVVSLTGASSLIGQTEGTIFTEVVFSRIDGVVDRGIIELSNTADNRISLLKYRTNRVEAYVRTGGVDQADILPATVYSGTIKIALAYSANDIALYVNGVQATNIQSNIAFSFTTELSALFLGSTVSASAFVNDRIRAAAIYPTRLTNSQLQSLTTL
jgi:hypothetical protein